MSEVSGIFTENFIFISTFKMRELLKLRMNGVFQSEIQFPTGPYDIENIPEKQLAVSFQSLKEIKFINLHTMSIARTVKVPVLVYGLRYMVDIKRSASQPDLICVRFIHMCRPSG